MMDRFSVFPGNEAIHRLEEREMVVCEKCRGNYDNGELVGGIYLECREEERQRQIRASAIARMINSRSYQMELRLEDMRNGK